MKNLEDATKHVIALKKLSNTALTEYARIEKQATAKGERVPRRAFRLAGVANRLAVLIEQAVAASKEK